MSNMRITGLASGMDTEQMIKDMMRIERMKVDSAKQNRDLVKWQQDAFRDVIRKSQAFQSKYFDTLNPTTNLKSLSAFSKFNYSVLSEGLESTAVSISASASATAFSATISKIDSLATKDTLNGLALDQSGIRSAEITDVSAFATAHGTLNFTMSIGSVSKEISVDLSSLTSGTPLLEDLATTIGSKIQEAFGSGFENVVKVDSTLNKLKFDLPGQTVKMMFTGSDETGLNALGIANGSGNLDYRTKTMAEILGWSADQTLTSGSKTLLLSKGDTIDQVIDKINKSDFGWKASFNSLNHAFKLEATKEGASNGFDFSDASTAIILQDLFNISNLEDPLHRTKAENAKLNLNGVDIVQSSNTFTLDGFTYTLNAITDKPIEVKADVNKTAIVDTIKGFIEDYNALIEDFNTRLTEKKYRDFKPLTADQREAMKEKEIEVWEEKAKSGMLRGNSELETFVNRMRSAFIDTVEGVGLSMSEIGISTKGYQDKGKLTLDVEKLNQKIETQFDDVVKLFSKSSTIKYDEGDAASASQRYTENGVANRLEDIIKDYTKTTAGKKGVFLQKAGIEKDSTFVQNLLSKEISRFDIRISSMEVMLKSKEDSYYQMFSRMESAMAKMQSQASSIMGMFGTGGN